MQNNVYPSSYMLPKWNPFVFQVSNYYRLWLCFTRRDVLRSKYWRQWSWICFRLVTWLECNTFNIYRVLVRNYIKIWKCWLYLKWKHQHFLVYEFSYCEFWFQNRLYFFCRKIKFLQPHPYALSIVSANNLQTYRRFSKLLHYGTERGWVDL